MKIIRNEKTITLTPEEVECAYNEHLRKELMHKAEVCLRDIDEEVGGLERKYGISLAEIINPNSSYYLLDVLADSFEPDINLPEKDLWETLCNEHLDMLGRSTECSEFSDELRQFSEENY